MKINVKKEMISLEFLNMNSKSASRIVKGPKIAAIHGDKRRDMEYLGDFVGSTTSNLFHRKLAHPIQVAFSPRGIVYLSEHIDQLLGFVIEIKIRNGVEAIAQIT
jgi:hypothetical protein